MPHRGLSSFAGLSVYDSIAQPFVLCGQLRQNVGRHAGNMKLNTQYKYVALYGKRRKAPVDVD